VARTRRCVEEGDCAEGGSAKGGVELAVDDTEVSEGEYAEAGAISEADARERLRGRYPPFHDDPDMFRGDVPEGRGERANLTSRLSAPVVSGTEKYPKIHQVSSHEQANTHTHTHTQANKRVYSLLTCIAERTRTYQSQST